MRPQDREQRDDEQMKERRVVGGVERVDGIVPVRPFPLAVQDGVVQFKALSLVIVERPAEEVHRVGDVHNQVGHIGQDGDNGQYCAE